MFVIEKEINNFLINIQITENEHTLKGGTINYKLIIKNEVEEYKNNMNINDIIEHSNKYSENKIKSYIQDLLNNDKDLLKESLRDTVNIENINDNYFIYSYVNVGTKSYKLNIRLNKEKLDDIFVVKKNLEILRNENRELINEITKLKENINDYMKKDKYCIPYKCLTPHCLSFQFNSDWLTKIEDNSSYKDKNINFIKSRLLLYSDYHDYFMDNKQWYSKLVMEKFANLNDKALILQKVYNEKKGLPEHKELCPFVDKYLGDEHLLLYINVISYKYNIIPHKIYTWEHTINSIQIITQFTVIFKKNVNITSVYLKNFDNNRNDYNLILKKYVSCDFQFSADVGTSPDKNPITIYNNLNAPKIVYIKCDILKKD